MWPSRSADQVEVSVSPELISFYLGERKTRLRPTSCASAIWLDLRRQAEAAALIGRDEVEVVVVLGDERLHELAVREHLPPARTGVIQRGADQFGGQTLALELVPDL